MISIKRLSIMISPLTEACSVSKFAVLAANGSSSTPAHFWINEILDAHSGMFMQPEIHSGFRMQPVRTASTISATKMFCEFKIFFHV